MKELIDFLGILLTAVGLTSPTIDYVLIRERRKFISPYLSIITLLISLLALTHYTLNFSLDASLELYGGTLKVDLYGLFFALIVTLGGILVSVASLGEVREWTTSPSFYSLLVLGVLGAYYLIFVNDLALLIAAWALVSVISYILAGMAKDDASAEGAIKYALMGIIASILMLYAVANIYGLTNSTNMSEIVDSLATVSGEQRLKLLFTVLLFISAFGFKIGVVPFHGWLPDVYGGVHPMLVSYLSGVVKVAGVAVIMRILYPVSLTIGNTWFILLTLLSIFSMTFGNVAALIQTNVQRMMAYSSIAHVGYILVGLVALSKLDGGELIYGVRFALPGIAMHLTAYAVAKVGVFVALAYLSRRGIRLELSELSGLGRKMPVLSVSITILLLSLMGVPPLIGFWGKFYLFISVVGIAPWLTFIALMNSGLSVGYYVQVIRYMFFAEGGGVVEERMEPETLIVLAATVLTVALGFILPILTPYLTLRI